MTPSPSSQEDARELKVTREMCEAGRRLEGAWGYSDGLLTNIYLAMQAARPTPDRTDDVGGPND
jgi:hypothetical protein